MGLVQSVGPAFRPAASIGLALLLALATAACANPEQPLVDRFFADSRLRDKTALQPYSRVIFEPHAQGIVRTFTIQTVSAERTDDGGKHVKDITVVAPVVVPDGRSVQQTIVLTVERADGNPPPTGYRWIIRAVRDAEGRLAPPL